MITAKLFSNLDGNGASGFEYDATGNDITPVEILQKMRAYYDIQIDAGPWKRSWCSVPTHNAGNNEDIENELIANLNK